MKSTRSLVKITWILFLILLCTISYTFAWFSIEYYVGNSLRYDKMISIISASNVVVKNYYVENVNGQERQTRIEENGTFALENMAPDQTQTFKTSITNNNAQHSVTINLFIDSFRYTPALNNYLYVSSYSQSTTNWYNYNTDYYTTTALIDGQLEELYQQVSICVARAVEIGAGETVTVTWAITLNKNAGDDCQGAHVLISNLIIGLT